MFEQKNQQGITAHWSSVCSPTGNWNCGSPENAPYHLISLKRSFWSTSHLLHKSFKFHFLMWHWVISTSPLYWYQRRLLHTHSFPWASHTFMTNHIALTELFCLTLYIRVTDEGWLSLWFTTIHRSLTLLNAAELLLIAMRHVENGTSSFVWHSSGSQDVKAVDSALS